MKKTFILASASWCGPCKQLKQRLLASGLLDRVTIKDADEFPTFFKDHNIKAVPRLVVYSANGEVQDIISGVEEIFDAIKK